MCSMRGNVPMLELSDIRMCVCGHVCKMAGLHKFLWDERI